MAPRDRSVQRSVRLTNSIEIVLTLVIALTPLAKTLEGRRGDAVQHSHLSFPRFRDRRPSVAAPELCLNPKSVGRSPNASSANPPGSNERLVHRFPSATDRETCPCGSKSDTNINCDPAATAAGQSCWPCGRATRIRKSNDQAYDCARWCRTVERTRDSADHK
jgi:hypothetical protein